MTNVFCFRRPEQGSPKFSLSLSLSLRGKRGGGGLRQQPVVTDALTSQDWRPGGARARVQEHWQQRHSGAAMSSGRPRRSPHLPSQLHHQRSVSSGSQTAHICHLFSKALSTVVGEEGEQWPHGGRVGPRRVWEPHTASQDCVLSLSLETEIDLNSEKGFALKEVERLVGGLRPEKLALISSSSRGQRIRLLSGRDCVQSGARVDWTRVDKSPVQE